MLCIGAYASNVPNYDSITYANYLQKDWKQLVKNGREAERADIDFYYLDYRMGIAYYFLANYMDAIPYFEAVVYENKADASAYSYLYYSLLYSGKEEQALLLKNTMPSWAKQVLNLPELPLVKSVLMLQSYSAFATEHLKRDLFNGIRSGETAAVPLKNTSYYFASKFRLGSSLRLEVAGTHLSSHSFQLFNYNGDERVFDDVNTQTQLYAKISDVMAKNVTFKLAGHYLNYSPNYHTSVSDTSFSDVFDSEISDTLIFGQMYKQTKDYVYMNNPEYSYHTERNSTAYNDFVVNTGLEYNKGKLHSGIGYTFLNFEGSVYNSINADVKYYPFGNFNTYFKTSATVKQSNQTDEEIQYYGNVTVGQRLAKNIHIALFTAISDINNYAQYDGSVVYNHSYTLHNSFGASLTASLLQKRLFISASFAVNKYSQEYYEYIQTDQKETVYNGTMHYMLEHPIMGKVADENYPFSYSVDEAVYEIVPKQLSFSNHTLKTSLSWYF